MRLERSPTIEVTAQPTVAFALPVHRVFNLARLSPLPASRTPQIGAPVPIVRDKSGELGLGHRWTGDGKRQQRDRVRPLFVVEHERLVSVGSELECSPRDLYITRQRARVVRFSFWLARCLSRGLGQIGTRIT